MPIGSYHAMGKPRESRCRSFLPGVWHARHTAHSAHRAAQAEPGTISGRIWLQRTPVKMTKKRAASRSPLLDDPSLLGMSLTPIFAAKSFDQAFWCGGAGQGEYLGGSPVVCKRRVWEKWLTGSALQCVALSDWKPASCHWQPKSWVPNRTCKSFTTPLCCEFPLKHCLCMSPSSQWDRVHSRNSR